MMKGECMAEDFLVHNDFIVMHVDALDLQDSLEPYLDTSKKIYKEMLSVQKNSTTGAVEVSSVVYRVKSIETQSGESGSYMLPGPGIGPGNVSQTRWAFDLCDTLNFTTLQVRSPYSRQTRGTTSCTSQ